MEPRAASPERRLAAVRALAAAGIPAAVLAAPMIPAVNDAELEAILERAAAAGATSAGYVLLRLPLEIKQLFEDWLARHMPDRAARVLSLVRQTRGGATVRQPLRRAAEGHGRLCRPAGAALRGGEPAAGAGTARRRGRGARLRAVPRAGRAGRGDQAGATRAVLRRRPGLVRAGRKHPGPGLARQAHWRGAAPPNHPAKGQCPLECRHLALGRRGRAASATGTPRMPSGTGSRHQGRAGDGRARPEGHGWCCAASRHGPHAAFRCSFSRGINSTRLQGRCRLSNWNFRISSQASLQAPVEPGSANR